MDIKTFVEVAKTLPANLSVLIRGNHGIGKSETIHQLATHFGLKLIDRRVSQMSEGDLLGLPKLDDNVTRFMPPDWVMEACNTPVLLFLDEINRGTVEVQQGCFQLVLDRQIQGHRLHPGTRVYAAVNTGGSYQVNEMDPAFIDRFVVLDFQPTPEDFYAHWENPGDFAGRTPMDGDMLRFLKERPTRLNAADVNPGTKQPSPRSWTRLDGALKANDCYSWDLKKDPAAKGRVYSIALGFVGVEAAADLVDYMSTRETRYSAEHVLNEYESHRDKINELGRDKLITLSDLVCEWSKTNLVQPDQAKRMGEFVGDLPAELRVGFMVAFTKAIRNTPNFEAQLQAIHPTVVPHIVNSFSPDGQLKKDEEKPAKVDSGDKASVGKTKAAAKKKK